MTTTSTGPAPAEYAFDNDTTEAANQLRFLAEILDPHSTEVLTRAGVRPGWHCLDLGAGGGTITDWLAGQVGETGHVTALDLKPQHISARPNVEIRAADLRTTDLPAAQYDLIHARLLLMHLAEREELVGRLAAALKPGGVLVVSDWECTWTHLVLAAAREADALLFDRFTESLLDAAASSGMDRAWARRTHAAMRAAGLADVHTVLDSRSWPGGTAGCLLHRSNSIQLEPAFLARGWTVDELNRVRRFTEDPGTVLSSYLMFTSVGRRPAGR